MKEMCLLIYCVTVAVYLFKLVKVEILYCHTTTAQRDRLEKLSMLAQNSKYSPNQSGLFFWCQIILLYLHHRQTNMTDYII